MHHHSQWLLAIAIIIVIITLIIGPLIGWETASLGDSPNSHHPNLSFLCLNHLDNTYDIVIRKLYNSFFQPILSLHLHPDI